MNLIVPINLQGLRVSSNDAAKITNANERFSGPTTSYNELPWRDASYNEFPGRLSKANLSVNIDNPLGGNVSAQLDPGVHLHWALPDTLTHGRQASGGVEYPAAPNRWLVTRVLRRGDVVSVKQWVVESDHLMTEDEYTTTYYPANRRKCVAIPVGWDLIAGTNPEDGGAVYYPPWRRLGRVFELAQWAPQTPDGSGDLTKVRHLDEFHLSAANFIAPGASLGPLQAVGHSGPSFSAYYPDCASAFGLHDTFADLDAGFDLDNAAFDVSYSVIGWHSSVTGDPLQSPDFLAAYAQAQTDNQAREGALRLGDSALYASVIEDHYAWVYDDGVGQPQRCVYAGQLVELPWDTTGNSPDLGDPSLPKCYLVPPGKDESVRIAVANSTSGALAALLQYELTQQSSTAPTPNPDLEFMLDALQLGLLNQIGSSYSLAELEQALNEHGFASHVGGGLWEIRAKSDVDGAKPVKDPGRTLAREADDLATQLDQLNRCQRRMNGLLAVIRSAQRQLFLDWYKYITTVFPQAGAGSVQLANQLRDYLGAQALDLWAKFEAAFGLKTPASAATQNLPVFYSGPDSYIRTLDGASSYATDSPATSIAGQIVALANGLIADLASNHPTFELQAIADARYWVSHDPVFVATGESLTPARRNGNLDALPCRVSSQIVASLSAGPASAAVSLTGAQAVALVGASAPDLRQNQTAEGKATQVLLGDVAALLGEAALFDSGLAASFAPKLSPPTHAVSVADLHGAMTGLARRIATAWVAGPTSAGQPSLPALLDDVQVSSGSVVATWSGRAPQGLGLTAQPDGWQDPFLPLSFVWAAAFTPFDKGLGAAAAEYDPGFIRQQFELDENAVELDFGATAPRPVSGAISLRGSVSLSSKAAEPLLDQIEKYLAVAGDQASLSAAVAYLRGKPLLSQGFDGVNTAMLGLEAGLQLRPFDPFYDSEPIAKQLTDSTDNFAYANSPTHFVAATAGEQTVLNPGGAAAIFDPIRAGYFDLVSVDVVDVFGRKRRLLDPSVVADRAKIVSGSAVKPGVHSSPNPDHQVYLPPRLAESARLRFRWLAADSEEVEVNSHPTTSPICGWVVPNHLDNSLALFSGSGDALGSLGVEGSQTTVTWRSPAGRAPASIASDLASANPTLRDLAQSIYGKDRSLFSALTDAIEDAHTYILPGDKQAAQALAVLMGRPLAVVKAGLRLEFEGLPPLDSSSAALEQAMKANDGAPYDWTKRDCAALTKVEFPARLGDRNHLEDGLVAYVLGDRGPFAAIYAPAAAATGSTGVVRPSADTITLAPEAALDPPASPYASAAEQIADLRNCDAADRQQIVTLLIDPHAKVHAATGVLPVKAIGLPPDVYAAALRKIAVSFFTHPILRSRQSLELPIPNEPGYAWGWTTGVLQAGVEQPNNESLGQHQLGDRAQFSYSPQLLEDGWLRLEQDPPSPPSPAETSFVLLAEEPPSMTLSTTFTNDTTQKPDIYIGRADLGGYGLTISTDDSTTTSVTQVRIQFPTTIFSVDDLKNIQATGWTAAPAGPYLTLTHDGGVPLDALTPIHVALTGVSSDKTAATNDDLRVHLGANIAATKIFLLQYPTGAAKLTDVLDVRLLPTDEVFRTPTGKTKIENVLGLLLKNKQPDKPLVTQPWAGRTPTVIVSFVYGDGIGALTPADDGASDPFSAWNIQISVEESYQNGKVIYEWSAKNPDPGGQGATPVWSLQPIAENPQVLGPQSGASVRFKIAGLATQNIAGSTQAYLQYSNFPGYDDGYFTLDLEKVEPRPTIIYFDGSPNYATNLGDSVTVKWQTFGVDKVELQFEGTTLSSARGDIDVVEGSYAHAIDRDTQFALLAYDKVTDAAPQHSLQWTGHVPEAQITAFTAGPHETVVGSPVTLSWTTVAARSAEIQGSDGSSYAIPAGDLNSGAKVFYPQRSTTFTLHVVGQGDPPDQSITLFYLPPGWSSRPMGINPHAGQGPVLLATAQSLVLQGGQSVNGVFASPDGQSWSQVGIAQFSARNDAAGTSHGGKLWIMGGTSAGQPLHDVWCSDGGINWTAITTTANWPPRTRFACASFAGKLWIMGGLDQNLALLADIWSSADGVTWTKVADPGDPASRWSPRSNLALAVHDQKLYLFGGLLADGSVSDELWVSADGVAWTKQTTGGRFSAIEGRQQAILASIGDSLYLAGGIDAQGNPLNDLNVYSGGSWAVATGPSGNWGVHRAGYAVFHGALWVVGGLDFNANNNTVWAYFPVQNG